MWLKKVQSFHGRAKTRVLKRAAMKRRMVLRSVDSAGLPAWVWLLDSGPDCRDAKRAAKVGKYFE
jgi:hypothetical protein